MAKFYGYDKIKFIGHSTNVVKARHIASGKAHAIKMVLEPFGNESNVRRLYRELKIMRKLTEIKKNIFTTKILDILLPFSAYL